MEKNYRLKTGDFYISKYMLCDENIEYDFLESLIFTPNQERALILHFTKAKYLKRSLFINAGIDCKMEEI